jgi:hypothetical protein
LNLQLRELITNAFCFSFSTQNQFSTLGFVTSKRSTTNAQQRHLNLFKMQYSPVNIFALLTLLFASLNFLVSATPATKRNPIPDTPAYPVWNFTTPDGKEHHIEGTVNDALAMREALDPTFKRTPINETTLASLVARHALEPRNQELPILCIPIAGWDWGYAYYLDVIVAEQALIDWNGWPQVPNDGCIMLYCDHFSSVSLWECNDVSFALLLFRCLANICKGPFYIHPNTAYLASYVGDVALACVTNAWNDNGLPNWETGGQQFDTDQYNVITRNNAGFC